MTDSLPQKYVLFVCIENSNRSQMAEAFARIHGGNLIEAYSAGSRPSGQVNRRAVSSMQQVGYDISHHQSNSLSDVPDVEYAFVATMGCGDECPHIRARQRADWDIPDPKDMDPGEFSKVRDLIECKVQEMLASL